jgi:hypothetical protein
MDAHRAPGVNAGAVAGDDDNDKEGGGATEQPLATNNGTIVSRGLRTRGGLTPGGRNVLPTPPPGGVSPQ